LRCPDHQSCCLDEAGLIAHGTSNWGAVSSIPSVQNNKVHVKRHFP
jgi:hypothetical protein